MIHTWNADSPKSISRPTNFKMPFFRLSCLLLALITTGAYWPGLRGDFVFDDNPHIVQNKQIHINSLSHANLLLAWSSSPFSFPNSRPLAMLSFGINHVYSGLDPFAFKATNLALHLLTGLVLFAVVRRLGSLFLRLQGRGDPDGAAAGQWAWLTAALWLLHPLNLSPVLLSVQRMTILSTLFVLLGLLAYLLGRQRLGEGGRSGLLLVWASPIFAVAGLLAKENALLLPLLLFVTEWALLHFRGLDPQRTRQLKLFFLVVAALPILAAIGYLLTHPGYLGFTGRPFDMTERVLTQARVLWFYVHMLLAPDISAMGLFHDDIAISRSLLQPWITLPAAAALAIVTLAAILLRKRLPLLSFAVLFFLAGHALESSVFPLELVYEHRNYLPAFAPLFALAYVPTVGASSLPISRGLLNTLIAAVLLSLAASTAMRAYDWSGYGRLITAEVEHHPDSRRANFLYAQLLMEQIKDPSLSADAANLASEYFERLNAVDPDHADGLFGLVVLELYQGRPPSQALINRLTERLRRIPWNPLNVTTAQFAYLVRWHDTPDDVPRLSHGQMISLFEAALANPSIPPIARGVLYHALRGYYQRVVGDLATALNYAELAVHEAPGIWGTWDRHVRLLAMLGRWDEAEAVLRQAIETDSSGLHQTEADALAKVIAGARRGELVPVLPPGRDGEIDGSKI